MLDLKALLTKLVAYNKDQVKAVDIGTTWVSSTSQTSFSKAYTVPTGYVPLWAWAYSDGAVRAIYVSEVRRSGNNVTVVGWMGGGTACNAHIILLLTKS